MYYIVGIILLLVILFFPLSIKLSVLYKDGHFNIFIYNKQLKLKKKVEKHKATPATAQKAEFNLVNFLPEKLRKVIYKVSDEKRKLPAKIDFDLHYGFDDAAVTAIFYGILNGLNSLLYNQFSFLLDIKKYEYHIVPHYNDPMFNFRLNCIISFNLAKIIYMLFAIYVF
ncbi:DUF2953 domain-containing protein [Clostridium thermarum]|uniref:DUF2953 domain-containing protein n=1 Tax=Clostridium thermarum TaxID=1716543 RepID=UPI00111E2804|nr:DUF2953 domain-containing protein [Clostridium thermarum]